VRTAGPGPISRIPANAVEAWRIRSTTRAEMRKCWPKLCLGLRPADF